MCRSPSLRVQANQAVLSLSLCSENRRGPCRAKFSSCELVSQDTLPLSRRTTFCHSERSRGISHYQSVSSTHELRIGKTNSKRCFDPFDFAQGKTSARHDRDSSSRSGREDDV